MRRLVVALLAAALALTVAGCGGSDKNAESDTAGTTSAQTAPPQVVAAQGAQLVPDRSPTETVTFTAISTQASNLPAAVQQRLTKKQPVLIYLYDKTQKASSETRAEVDAAVKSYRGLIDLVTYDMSRYVSTDAETGAVSVSPKLSSDVEASKVVEMAEQLSVTTTPAIIIVDSKGTVLWRSRGYTDRKLIEKEILRATE